MHCLYNQYYFLDTNACYSRTYYCKCPTIYLLGRLIRQVGTFLRFCNVDQKLLSTYTTMQYKPFHHQPPILNSQIHVISRIRYPVVWGIILMFLIHFVLTAGNTSNTKIKEHFHLSKPTSIDFPLFMKKVSVIPDFSFVDISFYIYLCSSVHSYTVVQFSVQKMKKNTHFFFGTYLFFCLKRTQIPSNDINQIFL